MGDISEGIQPVNTEERVIIIGSGTLLLIGNVVCCAAQKASLLISPGCTGLAIAHGLKKVTQFSRL
jgi:2-keto-3-deoxy-6-phosphogluconate aldolase